MTNALNHLKFSYDSLCGSLFFGPAVATTVTETLETAVVVALAGVASNLVSYQISKVSLKNNWTVNQTRCALFFSSFAIFAISACAMAVFGVPGAIGCTIAGAGVSFFNMVLFKEKIDAAKRVEENHKNWHKAHKDMEKYCESYDQYLKITNVNFATSPDILLKSTFNTPEKGTLFLSMVQESQEKINKLIASTKKSIERYKIQTKINQYFTLWDQISALNPEGILPASDISHKCHDELKFFTDEEDEDVELLNSFLDESLAKINKKFEELNLEPAA